MKAFLVLCLVAAAYGRTSWNPMVPAPEIIETPLRPSLPEVPVTIPGVIEQPGNTGIAPPLHIVDLPAEVSPFVQIIVNIIKNQQEKVPVGTFPLFPVEPETPQVLPGPVPEVMPLPIWPMPIPPPAIETFPIPVDITRPQPIPVNPELLRPVFPGEPSIETFPIPVDITRPQPVPVNPELLKPALPQELPQVEALPPIMYPSAPSRPATSLIRQH